MSLAASVALLMAASGCGGGGSTNPRVFYTYVFEGAVVDDPNVDSAFAVGRLIRSDTALVGAILRMEGYTLAVDTLDSTYMAAFESDSLIFGSRNFAIIDSSEFGDTIAFTVPNNLAISEVIPANRIKGTADRVRLDWTGSASTDGYIIAAVLRDSAYTGSGWARYSTSLSNSDSFNDSAFSKVTLQGLEPVPGIYYLYVYSYTGAPDSALSADLLPVPLPSQLGANVDVADLTGHVGSVVVTAYDSVEVVLATGG